MSKIPLRSINNAHPQARFSIREIGPIVSVNDMIQPLHRHDFFFLLILKKGTGQHVIDFKSYPVSDNSIFFLRPGQVHQLTLQSGSSGYLVEFSQDFYSPLGNPASRKMSNMNFWQPAPVDHDKLLALSTSIFQEYSGERAWHLEVIKDYLNVVFIELGRQAENSSNLPDSKSYAQERLDDLLQLLETHIAKRKQVSQYATMLHLTPYQLNAITKEALGKTCSELINEQIVLEAKRHLLATSGRINEIALELGYEDISYFIRFFKKHTGLSPQAFRENFR
jgi:AraC family transcriptional activator of pobA